MKLREFLDEVRFGNTPRLCVAVKGEYGFPENLQEGMYWKLHSGKRKVGSKRKSRPAIPEEIMEAEVDEIQAYPNLRIVYGELGQLCHHSLDTTVILVKAPDFDANSYWTDDKLNDDMGYESCYGHEWAYNIREDLWEQIQNLESDWVKLAKAVEFLMLYGLGPIQTYKENDFAQMEAYIGEIMGLANKIALLLGGNINQLVALCEILGVGTAFNRRFMDRK